MLAATMHHAAAPSHAAPAAGSRHPPTACSLQEAATLLGISLNTLRRRIDAGQVRAERIERPQGHVWRVYLDGVEAEQHAGQHAGSTLHQPPGSVQGQDAASTLPQPADGLLRAEAMASYTRSVLEPLVAALERSQARVAELEREAGTYAERLAGQKRLRSAAMAHAAELEARLATSVPPAVPDPKPDPFPRPNPPSPNVGPRRWRRWWLAVMGAGLVLMVGASCQQPTRSTVSAPHLCRAAQFSLARVEQELAPQANPVLGGTLMGTWTGVNELVTVIERLCRP